MRYVITAAGRAVYSILDGALDRSPVRSTKEAPTLVVSVLRMKSSNSEAAAAAADELADALHRQIKKSAARVLAIRQTSDSKRRP